MKNSKLKGCARRKFENPWYGNVFDTVEFNGMVLARSYGFDRHFPGYIGKLEIHNSYYWELSKSIFLPKGSIHNNFHSMEFHVFNSSDR